MSALWGLCVIRDRLDDLFDRVCETGQDAKEIRYSVDNGERSFSSKMVACYVSCPDDSKGEAGGSGDGESRVYQYIVLKKGGEYCRIVGDGKNAFRCQPYLLLEWWREFTGASPFGSELVYAVDRDRIVQVRTPFLLSRSLDEMAVSPKFFERPSSEKDKRTRSQMVEVLIDELLREPKKMFARKAFTRISDTPENKELRQKLYDATRLPGD